MTHRKSENTGDHFKELTVCRDDGRDLQFHGVLLGEGRTSTIAGFESSVEIYRTKGGRYVVALATSTALEGDSSTHYAKAFDDADSAFEWLLAMGQGTLTPASKRALKAAAVVDPAVLEASTEQID